MHLTRINLTIETFFNVMASGGWMLKAPPLNPRTNISRYYNIDPTEGINMF